MFSFLSFSLSSLAAISSDTDFILFHIFNSHFSHSFSASTLFLTLCENGGQGCGLLCNFVCHSDSRQRSYTGSLHRREVGECSRHLLRWQRRLWYNGYVTIFVSSHPVSDSQLIHHPLFQLLCFYKRLNN